MRSYKKYILHITIASVRFMASLSNIVNNISEGIHKIKGKNGHNNKKCETCRIQCKYCDWFLEFCNKKYQQKFDEKLKEWFFKTLEFSNHNSNKFILLLPKGVYRYEYMNDWEKFNDTLLEKEDFYNHLNMEVITDAD